MDAAFYFDKDQCCESKILFSKYLVVSKYLVSLYLFIFVFFTSDFFSLLLIMVSLNSLYCSRSFLTQLVNTYS